VARKDRPRLRVLPMSTAGVNGPCTWLTARDTTLVHGRIHKILGYVTSSEEVLFW